ncbi:hypothetical protein BGX31_008744 [Mortierella sp. GBA43]|nr:hypothetical protein BGX31_008744 [Mortierella sp. GBA43]
MDPDITRSWEKLLHDLDERTITQTRKRSATAPATVVVVDDDDDDDGKSHGPFKPITPEYPLAELKKYRIAHAKGSTPEPSAEPISAEEIKRLKLKRQRLKNSLVVRPSPPPPRLGTEHSSGDGQSLANPNLEPTLPISSAEIVIEPDDRTEVAELELAIDSLLSKLEILQPEGMRPSDIAAAAAQAGTINTAQGTTKEESAEGDASQSQTTISQRSILLWDDVNVIIQASESSSSRIQLIAKNAVIQLGLDNLEDSVLHRLCINEIFVQDQDDRVEPTANVGVHDEGAGVERTKSPQMTYQFCTRLYSVLLCPKALRLKSIPSRLFLDAVLKAGQAQGRAIVDSVLMPVVHDLVGFSKLSSELVQKTLKEQASTTVIHFLSGILDTNAGDPSIFHPLPAVFLSEVHMATVQTILGLNNVPCPLPTRLWNRFNTTLEQLWEHVATSITSTLSSSSSSNSPPNSLKEACETQSGVLWILKLYCPPDIWESVVKDKSGTTGGISSAGSSSTLRLSNPKLAQLVMTWTIRQGAMCPDVESLQRLREFCATRLDVKLGKGIVSKLDMFIKKKYGPER